ncbi:MAG: hypothetical protein PHQ80_01380 [Candidatus ainarchaeum sp.]|nr:hypothetical protein [Candidatus ainarchaeum sp.]
MMGAWDSLSRGFDLSGDALRETFAFHKVEFRQYIKYWLLMTAFDFGAIIAAAIPFAALFFILVGNHLSGTNLIATAAALSVLAILLALPFVMLSISTLFSSMRYVMGNMGEGFVHIRDRKPALKYMAFYAAISLALFLVLLGAPLALMLGGSLSGSGNASAAGFIGGILLFYAGIFLFIILFYLFSFIFTYGVYEIAAEGMGPVAALKRSYALVKSHFWETLVFFLVLFAISYALGVVMQIVLLPFLLVLLLSPFLGIVLLIPVALMLEIVENALLTPFKVFFWMKIRE